MKRILTFWLLSAFIALGANLPIGNVSVRTNGVLVWPTNFFSTNRLLIQAVITNTGSGSGTNTSLTNLVDVRVNTPGLADGNVLKWVAAHGFWTNATDEGGATGFQPASGNLTNWSTIPTNQVVWTNALVALTNGFVTWTTTNTLVATNTLASLTNGFVTWGTTNTLVATNTLPSLTNGFVTWGTTNTLLPTNSLPTLFGMTNPLANTNGNFIFSGPVFSSASSTNSPAYNELVVANWVRTLLSSGYHIYTGTNVDAEATGGNGGTNVYQFQSDIPYRNSRNYTNPALNEYVGVVISTNKLMTLQGPIDISIYLNISGGGAAMTVHPEIYYTYDKTNLLGDFDCAGQAIGTTTNLYQFVVTFPTVTATNATGFYLVRKLKVDSKSGASPVLTVSVGTNTPSHVSYSSTGLSGDYVTWGTTNTLATTNVNTAIINGLVKRGAGQNSKVWKTDIDGLPEWRTDETGAATNANIDAFTGTLGWSKISTNQPTPSLTNVAFLGGTYDNTSSNIVVDMSLAIRNLWLTNQVFFNSTTNRNTNGFTCATFIIYADGTARNLYFNSSWNWYGTTNNPPTSLAANKSAILSIMCNGYYETNIHAGFVAKP